MCRILVPCMVCYFDGCIVFFSDETAKWEKITYVAIVSCTAFAIYNLSKGHPHHEEPPVSFFWAHLNISNWSTRPWIIIAIEWFIRWICWSGYSQIFAFIMFMDLCLVCTGTHACVLFMVHFIISCFLTRHLCAYRHTHICTFATRSSPGVCSMYLSKDLNLMVIWFLFVLALSIDFILFGAF